MKYLKLRTTGNLDYVPVGWNLDSIIMMMATTSNIRKIYAVDAAAQTVSVNVYDAELNNVTINGTSSITTWATDVVSKAINANPNADVIPCVGADAVTGEAVLWEDYSFNN